MIRPQRGFCSLTDPRGSAHAAGRLQTKRSLFLDRGMSGARDSLLIAVRVAVLTQSHEEGGGRETDGSRDAMHRAPPIAAVPLELLQHYCVGREEMRGE